MKRVILTTVLFVLAWCTQVLAQGNESALTGVVLNAENGKPIPGVRVAIPGVSTAITDDYGSFRLDKAMKGAVIQLRAPGMANKDEVVGLKRELTILMHDESLKTMYRQAYSPFGDKDWQAVTGAVTVVSNKENYKKGATSSETLIQNEGLGVNTVIKSGMPGAGGNMYLWGFSSLYASAQPMVLIDGVPFENMAVAPSLISGNNITPLCGLDIKDIESITILKNATSLYGSKGGNGVILIETAKAREHATKIDFYAYAGLNQVPFGDGYPMMNSWEYRSYLTELLGTTLKYGNALELQNQPFINQEKPVMKGWGGIEGNKDYYRYNQETDWQKEVFKSSLSQNYYMSIKGGDDIALYSLSVGYLDHKGIVENTDFSRYSTQFNSQLNITRWFKMFANVNVSYNDRKLAYEGELSNFSPIYTSLVKAPFMAPYVFDERGVQTPNYEQGDIFSVSNPTALVDERTAVLNKTYRFFGYVGASADLGRGFDLNTTFGVTFDKSRENIFFPSKGIVHEPLPSGPIEREMKALVSRYLQYYTDFHLKYRRVIDGEHKVSALLGTRYQTNNAEGDWIFAYNSLGTGSDDMRTVGNGALDLASSLGLLGSWKWLSFYLNGEYSYAERYFVSYNMAVDGSSRFGAEADALKIGGNAFGVFPSVTAAWLASSEDFMSNVEAINVLKLRVGYSVAGNDDIGNYSARSTYASQNIFGFQGLVRYNVVNPALQWETNTKLNAGVDIAMFNDRLSASVDVFQSKTTNMLTMEKGKDYYGLSSYLTNNGALQNRGVELGLRGRIISAADVKWDLGVNITSYRNEVTAIQDGRIEIADGYVRTAVGGPVGQFYGYKTNGVYATSEAAAADGLHTRRGNELLAFGAGDMRFVNMNTDNVIDENDMTVIGNPNPDFFGSIVSKVQWKRFIFDMVWTYSYGNDIYNAVRASLEAMADEKNQTRNVINRWSREGHVTNTPRAVWGDPMGNARFSDRWIEDGSYLRLKSLSLSYDVPINIRLIRGIQVYATANNLLTFTKYLGYDPEFSAMQSPLYYGVDLGMQPQPRTVLLGVRLGL